MPKTKPRTGRIVDINRNAKVVMIIAACSRGEYASAYEFPTEAVAVKAVAGWRRIRRQGERVSLEDPLENLGSQ